MLLRREWIACIVLALGVSACGGGGSAPSQAYVPTTPQTSLSSAAISLVHNALVYDAVRGRYYASVPGSTPVNGNRIATINPTTAAVTYSAQPVGSEPWAMAVNADASALYVALNGTGDVVKLSLPDFAEQWRVRLPTSVTYGQLVTEQVAVSPTDADVVAVSTVRVGVSPRHGGVALIRNGVLQSRMTQEHTGSNLITFGASGDALYGFNNETTEFGLRRISVVADGLQEAQVVAAAGDFGTRSLNWSAQGLMLERTAYRTTDLAVLGQANAQGGRCRPHNVANRFVCAYSPSSQTSNPALAVVNATSFVVLATPVYATSTVGNMLSDIVPGPAGQVALRMNSVYWNSPADTVQLLSRSALQQ